MLTVTYSGQYHPTQSLFYNKVLNISCDLLNTVLKVKNGMTIWVQHGLFTLVMVGLLTGLWPPLSGIRERT